MHRGRAVLIQTMFLGNDPERERAFIPLMSNEVDLPRTKQNKENHFQNNQMRLVLFHLDGSTVCSIL